MCFRLTRVFFIYALYVSDCSLFSVCGLRCACGGLCSLSTQGQASQETREVESTLQ